MSDDENLLEKELEEVQRLFNNHPYISIVSTEGTPVNKYIVEYRVKGLVRLDDGEIATSDQHRIEISLSFGFPHFPPNCKPLTQIFHPDIDPSAIKIADFWTADESLASLISYIGQMICWQVYSEENVFNQDAATWLAENSDSVPLDSVDLAGGQVSEDDGASGEDGGAPLQDEVAVDLGLSAADLPELAFESVDLGDTETVSSSADHTEPGVDLDFAVQESATSSQSTATDALPDIAKDLDFGFKPPEITEDTPAEIVVEELDIETVPSVVEPPADEVEGEVDLDFATVDVDHDILCGMLDQCNFFAAQKKINTMAPENLSQASADLRPEIEISIKDAEKIFQEATALEEQGLLEEAARKFEGVLNITSDYPDLDKHMKRVRNAWMAEAGEDTRPVSAVSENQDVGHAEIAEDVDGLAGITLSLESDEDNDVPEANAFPQPEVSDSLSLEQPMYSPASSEPTEAWSPPGAEVKAKKKTTPPLKAPVQEVKSKSPLLIAGVVVLLIVALSGWIFLEWTSFNKAKEKWATVNTLLENGEYAQVSQQCEEITQLLGRVHLVMASGKKEILAQIHDIEGSEHFQEAMGGKVYYKNKYISKKAHEAYLEIDKLVAEGEKKGAISDWQGALVSYEAALDVAEKNKKRLDEEFYAKVVFNVKQAQFANHVAQGKKAFISKAWKKAVTHFNEAMELAKVKDVADPTSSYDVNRYLQRAKFSQFFVDGDAFLKKGKWKKAVLNFQGAYDIAKQEGIIDRASKESVTLKLHQTTLMKGLTEGDKFTKAKKWAQAVAEYEKAESVLPYDISILGKSVAETQDRVASSLLNALFNREQEEARAYYANKEYEKAVSALNRSIRAIDSSSLKDKAQWQLMRKQAEADLKRASLQRVVEEKTAYLEENYKGVFVENFVGVRVQALDQPQIKFLEVTDSALVFRLRCRELRDLKYYTLELIYQYDMSKDKWGFQGGE